MKSAVKAQPLALWIELRL